MRLPVTISSVMPVRCSGAVDTIRNIAVGTKSEVYQIGAESAVRFLVDTGLNLAEGIAENVAEVALKCTFQIT